MFLRKKSFLENNTTICELISYFSKVMFKSWLVAHENWVSVG
jgi:hypothetical protein